MAMSSLTYNPSFSVEFFVQRFIQIMQIGHILIKIIFKSSSLKPLNQIKPNLAGLVLG
jgi:hypothetical protein